MAPFVSFLMAAHNARPYIQAAIKTALSQRGVAVEVIVADDASSDGTAEIADEIGDPRVRVVRSAKVQGPARQRNVAIREAHGEWLAVLDADDVIHPDRSRLLIEAAEESRAELVADDIVSFNDGGSPHFVSAAQTAAPPVPVEMETWIAHNSFLGGRRNYGYWKPMLRSSTLKNTGVTYDERLRIGEDYIFVLNLLSAGTSFIHVDRGFYGYRQRNGAISRTLDPRQIELLTTMQEELLRDHVENNEAMATLIKRFADDARSLAGYQILKRRLTAKEWHDAAHLIRSNRGIRRAVARLALNRFRDTYWSS